MNLLSFFLKELLHELAAFFFKHATRDGATRVEGMRRIVAVAALFVATAVDDAGNLTPTQGAGTHGAGFYCDVKRAVRQVFAAQLVGGLCDGLHLGMGRHVVQRLCQVVGAGNDAVLAHDNGAYGDFALVVGGLRLGQRLAHI